MRGLPFWWLATVIVLVAVSVAQIVQWVGQGRPLDILGAVAVTVLLITAAAARAVGPRDLSE